MRPKHHLPLVGASTVGSTAGICLSCGEAAFWRLGGNGGSAASVRGGEGDFLSRCRQFILLSIYKLEIVLVIIVISFYADVDSVTVSWSQNSL